MKQQKGFTLVELLVAIAIIALIGILAGVAVSAARSKQRDATRLSNVRQLQSVLENHFNEVNAYPDGEALPLGDVTQSACLSTNGFLADCTYEEAVFLNTVIGTYSEGLEGLVVCGDPVRSAFCYTQKQEGDSYGIEFELENGLTQVGLIAGVNCATPQGMGAGSCQ
jgi:prepilin-type N-terminal cleavage/methylation domain-containing protein